MRGTTLTLLAGLALFSCAPEQGTQPTALAPRVELPSTPDGTLQEITAQLTANNPSALWAALPTRYQADLEGLLRELATKVDAKTYDTSFSLARRIAVLLDSKKDFFLSMPMIKMAGADARKLEQNWGAFAKLVRTLTESEVSTLDGLAKLDVETFLRGTGHRFMSQLTTLAASARKDPFERLRKASFKVVKVDGDEASVRMQQGDSKRGSTLKLRRIDGRWLPANMVDDWDKEMAKAKERLAKMSPKSAGMATTMALKMVEGFVEQLEAAQTQEDFDKVFEGLFSMRARPGR